MDSRLWKTGLAALSFTLLFGSGLAEAQFAERSGLPGSNRPDVDCSGRSIKNKRVRAVHSDNPNDLGTSAYFIQKDPFLGMQLGRNLVFREFRTRDGVFDASIAGLGGPMPDGTTAKITANNQVSCSGCHNLPQGNPGGAVNFSKDSGRGRNSPHFYGAGVFEMLALQIRADMLSQLDTDMSGWVSAAEAAAGGSSVLVTPRAGWDPIDYGRPSLSGGGTGTPALNNIFHVWYVDAAGQVVAGATEVDGVTTSGYDFEMIVWGWGQGPGRAALNPTNRAFLWDPWKAHGGLEAYDPTTNEDPDGDGISGPTLAGAIQFPVTHSTPDKGTSTDPKGFSTDDPDGDGFLTEISEGDLDLAEWYMLNIPRPAFAGTDHDYTKGVRQLERLRCLECHVPDWQIHAQDAVFDGDRRLVDLEVAWDAREQRLEGSLVRMYTETGGTFVPDRDAFYVESVFTDFLHHDMGAGFAETDFGGNVNTLWRTAPLWGVGSGFPWGHDGASLTLHDVIMRHGGEAADSRDRYANAPAAQQEKLLEFLRRLQLYDIETLPTDLDGNGLISPGFIVAGQDTGMERFNLEWLFNTPLQIQGDFVNTDGVTVRSYAGVNIDDAYGQTLLWRADDDDDGWPNMWDNANGTTGYLDGVN